MSGYRDVDQLGQGPGGQEQGEGGWRVGWQGAGAAPALPPATFNRREQQV